MRSRAKRESMVPLNVIPNLCTMSSVSRVYEHGVLQFLYEGVAQRVVSKMIEQVTPTLARKISPTIEKDEPEYIPIGLINIGRLLQAFLALIFVSFIALITEIMINCSSNFFKLRKEKKIHPKVVRRRRRPPPVKFVLKNTFRTTQRELDRCYSRNQRIDWEVIKRIKV